MREPQSYRTIGKSASIVAGSNDGLRQRSSEHNLGQRSSPKQGLQRQSRRQFLAAASIATAATATVHADDQPTQSANEQLQIGMIGVGGRGTAHMKHISSLAKKHNVTITAVCDVWRVNLDRAAGLVKQWFGHDPKKFTRFEELLELKDIDAVVISTPDFSHTPIMIAAMKAGKDVYVEKPMSITIEEANAALDLARKTGRVVQVGTQYRSHGGYRAAAKELATGILGHISRVTAAANFNHARWARRYDDCKKKDVDWPAYLFNRPMRPFDPRLLRCWHLFREFTNGLAGLWMSHYVDIVHLLTSSSYPRSAVSHGGVYVWKDGREHTDTFHTLIDYPEGFLFSWSMGLANSAGTFFAIYGTEGTLEVGTAYMNPNKLLVTPKGGLKDSKVKEHKIQPEPSIDHMANWLECIRSREKPTADILYGHQHSVAGILAATALDTGCRQCYDPEKRTISPG